MSEFERQRLPNPSWGEKPPKRVKLSTLFLLTTLIAVAASGYSRGQSDGIWIALFSFWFIGLGFACVVLGVTSRTSGRYLLLIIGALMSGLGMLAFATFEYW